MKLGLLVCDHVSADLLPIAGDYDAMFRRLFAAHPEVEVVAYDVVGGEMPDAAVECDAWLTTGSRRSVNDDAPWIRKLEAFVRQLFREEVPFVGVCFGHQLLAKALGGEVSVSPRGWGLGIKEVALRPGELFIPAGVESLSIFNSHSEQVTALPEGAEVVGWNEHCPVSVFTLGETMLGIQGHPEIGADYGRALIESRRGGLVPEDVAVEALSSLEVSADTEAAVEMILSFLRGT